MDYEKEKHKNIQDVSVRILGQQTMNALDNFPGSEERGDIVGENACAIEYDDEARGEAAFGGEETVVEIPENLIADKLKVHDGLNLMSASTQPSCPSQIGSPTYNSTEINLDHTLTPRDRTLTPRDCTLPPRDESTGFHGFPSPSIIKNGRVSKVVSINTMSSTQNILPLVLGSVLG